ncbi:hypothetical protein [Pseudomonas sp. zfem002]|uniref:hypothetical protein n=1 Tax=Pseudomonas sp. zfem002 TaxID=3078197 RepID=UPI002929020A|nr:hypothetical protein [Pseudomonas sp. zfem002]MDU9393608.1 hypothetical protein [Pseudomonas sp. zfem002]
MDIKHTLLPSLGFLVAAHFSASAQAGMPASCFQTPYDYEIYQRYGLDQPPNPTFTIGGQAFTTVGSDDKRRAWEHGPAKRKPLTINVTEQANSSHGKLYLDAGASTTNSGRIRFEWVPASSADATTGQSAQLGVDLGTRDTAQLKVTDPVCEVSASRTFKVPVR